VLTDLHCHILPGIDDGPATLDASVAIARAAVSDGVQRVVATPHVNDRRPNTAAAIAERVLVLRDALRDREVPLEIVPGAEVAAARVEALELEELRGLTLGDSRWLLLEAPMSRDFAIEETAGELMANGFGILLAHPERCMLFQRDPRRVRDLVEAGARTSVTAGALLGDYGRPARALGRALLAMGLVDNVVSDAHDLDGRPPALLSDLGAAGLADRADAWCRKLPAELLGDGLNRSEPGHEAIGRARALAGSGASLEEIAEALEALVPAAAARRIAARALHAAADGTDHPG